MRYLIIILLFVCLSQRINCQSIVNKQVYTNSQNDSITIFDDYVEFNFGGIMGGGNLAHFSNKEKGFKIIVDNKYAGKSNSTYKVSEKIHQDNQTFYLNIKDQNDKLVMNQEVLIYTVLDESYGHIAKQISDGSFILHLDSMPKDSLIHIDTYGFDPIRIKIENLTSSRFSVILHRNPKHSRYLNYNKAEIICTYCNDSTLSCNYKFNSKLKDFIMTKLYKSNAH